MIHYICALKCEAAPLIAAYKLEHLGKAGLFGMYYNETHQVSLTLSGIGKLAAAAATVYTCSMLECGTGDVWLNLGVAGHHRYAVGDVYLASRIEDAGSSLVWHPQLPVDTDIPAAGLLCLDQPSTEYCDVMYDMESAGFMYSASRCARAGLLHCIKIISDNRETAAENISAAVVSGHVSAARDRITGFAAQLAALAGVLHSGPR